MITIQLDGEVQNLVRRRRSPTDLTGGGISFGSGFTLGSGLGLAGFFSHLKPSQALFWVCNLYLFRLGNCLQCSHCKSVFWTGSCCSHWVKQPIGLWGPNCQAHSTSSRRGAVLVVCYKLKKFYNKMSTFILCWTAPCHTPMTKLRQMFKYQIFIF